MLFAVTPHSRLGRQPSWTWRWRFRCRWSFTQPTNFNSWSQPSKTETSPSGRRIFLSAENRTMAGESMYFDLYFSLRVAIVCKLKLRRYTEQNICFAQSSMQDKLFCCCIGSRTRWTSQEASFAAWCPFHANFEQYLIETFKPVSTWPP